MKKRRKKELKCQIRVSTIAMHTQERPCVRRILHIYVESILHMHKLKNRYTHAKTDLRTHESKLRMQE